MINIFGKSEETKRQDTLKKLYDKQEGLEKYLTQQVTNLKKLNKNDRTEQRISGFWEKISNTWLDFAKNHQQLLEFGEKTGKYFDEDVFGSSKGTVKEAKEFVEQIFPDIIQAALNNSDILDHSLMNTPPMRKKGDPFNLLGGLTPEKDGMGASGGQNDDKGQSVDSSQKKDDPYPKPQKVLTDFWSHRDPTQKSKPGKYDDKGKVNDNTQNKDEPPQQNNGTPMSQQDMMMYINGLIESNQKMLQTVMAGVGSNQRYEPIQDNKIDASKIPVFNGKRISDYKNFKILFGTFCDSRSASDVAKFATLRDKLDGKAKELVGHLHVTPENYKNAWKLLKDRYEDARLVMGEEFEALRNLQPTRANDHESIRRLTDRVRESVYNLQVLEFDVVVGGAPLVHDIIKKLDTVTQLEFERNVVDKTVFPTLETLIKFLDDWYHTLKAVSDRPQVYRPQHLNYKKQTFNHLTTEVSEKGKITKPCLICNESNHRTTNCSQLRNSPQKAKFLISKKLCIYCASHRYDARQPCRIKNQISCEICRRRHVTAVHDIKTGEEVMETTNSNYTENKTKNSASETLLPTAVATVVNDQGIELKIRCLIDQGSQSCYITEDAVQKLKLHKRQTKTQIITLGGDITNNTTRLVIVGLKIEKKIISFKALVVKRISQKLPNCYQSLSWISSIKDLADPTLNKPGPVHMLLGANITGDIFLPGVQLVENYLLQHTKLGWIVSGNSKQNTQKVSQTFMSLTEMETNLKTFWDLPLKDRDDEIEESEYCENLFKDKHYRENGRYVVPIPWIPNGPELKGSYLKALNWFITQERRINSDPEHKKLSNDFMQEYLDLGHMTELNPKEHCDNSGQVYYIPYFSIIRKDALSSKIRNVFNASAKSDNGVCLNDTIYPGGKLQTSIVDIVTKARAFPYIYGSDITKMFRQILIPSEDQNRLRILWRDEPTKPIREFKMNTVTYGVDCAPWQAIRTIHQIAEDWAPNSEIKTIIKECFYMDDLLSGSDTIASCKEHVRQINTVLKTGKMTLTKWTSNHPEILEEIPDENKISTLTKSSDNYKMLGLRYFPSEDAYGLNIKPASAVTYTKRGLLSLAASLFDPLGWILPVVMGFRILLQLLWVAKLDWDTPVPENIKKKFADNIDTVNHLSGFRVNRWLGCTQKHPVELIGFCDASNNGYAAVVYSRLVKNNEIIIHLVAAKGRVTPLKLKQGEKDPLLTIPKLELESLLLLAELFKEVMKNLGSVILTAYTDSMVVLSWVRSRKALTDAPVRRRVKKISKLIPPERLHHVSSNENPADAASRGMDALTFSQHHLWKSGPSWLREKILPTTPFPSEEKIGTTVNFLTADSLEDNVILRFSSFNKMLKILTLCRRWKSKCTGTITTEELEVTKKQLILTEQRQYFEDEIKCLTNNKRIQRNKWLTALCPFLDKDGLLRVGGRLANALMEENRKHPVILSKLSPLSKLIVSDAHYEFLHAGPGLMETIVKENCWIPGLKSLIKKVYRTCIKCLKIKAKTGLQLMADLPPERVRQSPIFSHTGVDLAGPFILKSSRIRNASGAKHWVALFICLATKLVHLELLTELSTRSFLEGFTRFCSRRGLPETMLSDNGTNFVGASRVLREQWQKMVEESGETLAVKGIKWRFIPSLSPTFGGIWEAAVKSFKYFLKRVNNSNYLLYDEFTTVICSIEAIMNSRPLCPLSEDVNEIAALTPAHFAIQRTLLFPPTPSDPQHFPTATKRWNQLQNLMITFWDSFRSNYLQHLQSRCKWQKEHENLKEDDLVVLKEPGSPVEKWKLGRVISTHPDKKNQVRKVTLKTGSGHICQRGVNTLVPLTPLNETVSPRMTRNQKRANLLSSTVLFLSLIQLVTGSVTLMSQTINVRKLQEVRLKAIDITFTVQTPLNFTNDIAILHEQCKIIDELCQQYSNKEAIKLRCNQFQNSLRLDVEVAIKHLNEKIDIRTTEVRGKRWVAAVVMGLGQIATMIGMGCMYLELSNENTDLKRKIAKISTILLNATEVEFDNLESKLNEVIETQNLLQILGELDNLSELASGLVQNIINQYDHLDFLTPITELDTYIKELQTTIPNIERPYIPLQQLFTPIRKFVDNDLVCVVFNIPLIEKERYFEYLIALDPSAVNYTLSNGKFASRIIVNKENDTFIEIHDSNKLPYVEYFIKRRINLCELNILRNNLNKCPVRSTSTWTNGIDLIQDHWLMFYKKEELYNASTTCKGNATTIHKGMYLINLVNCTLETEDFLIEDSQAESTNFILKESFERKLNESRKDWSKDLNIVSPVVDNHEELKKASEYVNSILTEEDSVWNKIINDVSNWLGSIASWISFGLLALCLLIIITVKCTKTKKPAIKNGIDHQPSSLITLSLMPLVLFIPNHNNASLPKILKIVQESLK